MSTLTLPILNTPTFSVHFQTTKEIGGQQIIWLISLYSITTKLFKDTFFCVYNKKQCIFYIFFGVDSQHSVIVVLQEQTSLFGTLALEKPSLHTWPRTGQRWGCLTVITPSAWAPTQTRRPTASCLPNMRSGYGVAATPSRAAARASPAEPTPI